MFSRVQASPVFHSVWAASVLCVWQFALKWACFGCLVFTPLVLIWMLVFMSVFLPSVCQLLDFEARSGEQVPLLLKMKRSQLALSKAVESGDTDLGECDSPAHHLSVRLMMSHWWFSVFSVYTVVTYLKNEMNRGDFFMTLRNQPVALSLYRQVLFIIILIWLIDWLIYCRNARYLSGW